MGCWNLIVFIAKFFTEHLLDAIIGGIIGAFIERYFTNLSKRRRVDKELTKIKNHINSIFKNGETFIIDELFDACKKLKLFFDRNFELLEIPQNNIFYIDCLKNPSVSASLSDAREWFTKKDLSNKNRQKKMLHDLDNTISYKYSKLCHKILHKIYLSKCN